jgi:uncharacterized Rmd1/YagE family protein
MLKVEAFQVAEQINIKKFRSEFTSKPFFASNFELFYVQENEQYLNIFNYGVVVFAGYSDVEKSSFIRFLKAYAEKTVEGEYKEDLVVTVKPERKLTFSFSSLTVPELDENAVRVIMLNTAQSVAMEYYEKLGNEILESTKKFTDELENFGKIRISRTNLMKFIGKTLNVQNSIFDNLYVFNAPDIVWESEYLEKLDRGLIEMFDIRTRFRELDYGLKIVENNLKLFTELSHNRESTRLEWIVILLIMFEVVDIIVRKLLEW